MNNLKTRFPEGMPVYNPILGNGIVVGYYGTDYTGPHLVVTFTRNGDEQFKMVMHETSLFPAPLRRNRNRSRGGTRRNRSRRSRSGTRR